MIELFFFVSAIVIFCVVLIGKAIYRSRDEKIQDELRRKEDAWMRLWRRKMKGYFEPMKLSSCSDSPEKEQNYLIEVLYIEAHDNCWVNIPADKNFRELHIDYYPEYVKYTEYKKQGDVYAESIETWDGQRCLI